MCLQLQQFREATVAYAAGFDPALLSAEQATAVVAGTAVIENAWHTIKTLAAARAADTADGRPAGQRVAAEDLARITGTSLGAARQLMTIGRHLRAQPAVEVAARQGRLSAVQMAVISDAAAADPTAEQRLLATAGAATLGELRDECARTNAAAEPDPDRRYDQIKAGRSLRQWTDPGGVGHLAAHGPVDDLAQIRAALTAIAERRFHQARLDGRRESPAAHAFDALVELALDATSAHPDNADPQPDSTGAGPTAAPDVSGSANSAPRRPRRARHRRGALVKLLIRVDLDTWLRGFPIEDEVCELVGHGPIPVSVVDKLLEHGDPFVAAILTRAHAVAGVAHLGRKPTAYQRSALEWLYPTCAVLGCVAHDRLQGDHRIDWAKTHFTMVDWMDQLCHTHHILKTRDGWALVDGTGKRAFVPPDDPRHPRHTNPEAA